MAVPKIAQLIIITPSIFKEEARADFMKPLDISHTGLNETFRVACVIWKMSRKTGL